MSTFHSLNLREPINKHQKAQTTQAINRKKHRENLKEILASNIAKKFQGKVRVLDGSSSLYLSKVIQREVDRFIEERQLTQQNLKVFHRELTEILRNDPNVELLNPRLGSVESTINNSQIVAGTKDASQLMGPPQQERQQERNGPFQLPKINSSTPMRGGFPPPAQRKAQTLKKNSLKQSQQFGNKGRHEISNPYGLNMTREEDNSRQQIGPMSTRFQKNNTMFRQSTDSQGIKEISKSFADLRVKMGERKQATDDLDQGEEVAGDEWNQIVRYEMERFEEEKRREREKQEEKKKQIKDILDQQLKEKNRQRSEARQAQKDFDKVLLESIKVKEEQEMKKQSELRNKILQEKVLRDVQLREAKDKRQSDYQRQRENELEFVSKLKREIQEEKEGIIEKKRREREAAQRIIHENEQEKQKKLQEREKEREEQNRLMEAYNRKVEEDERKRANEMAQREERIQNFMSKMQNQVIKKSNDAEKEAERRAMQFQMEREEREAREDERRRQLQKRKNEEIKASLSQQMQEKQMHKRQELMENEVHMKEWIDITEKDERRRKEKEKQHREQLMQTKEYQLRQMGELPPGGGTSIATQSKKPKHAAPMNAEEIRMNRELLREISRRKQQRNSQNNTPPE